MVLDLNLLNNKQLTFGNVYGVAMLLKEVELDKAQNLELTFQVPDIGKGIEVHIFFSFYLNCKSHLFNHSHLPKLYVKA